MCNMNAERNEADVICYVSIHHLDTCLCLCFGLSETRRKFYVYISFSDAGFGDFKIRNSMWIQWRGNFFFLDESTFIMVIIAIHGNVNCN